MSDIINKVDRHIATSNKSQFSPCIFFSQLLHARYVLQLLCETRRVLKEMPNITHLSTSYSKEITVCGKVPEKITGLGYGLIIEVVREWYRHFQLLPLQENSRCLFFPPSFFFHKCINWNKPKKKGHTMYILRKSLTSSFFSS